MALLLVENSNVDGLFILNASTAELVGGNWLGESFVLFIACTSTSTLTLRVELLLLWLWYVSAASVL